MSLIRSLTAPQRAALEQTIGHWIGIARSTAALDRDAARQAIADLYRAAGHVPPEFLFVASPAACPLAWRTLHSAHADGVGNLLSSNLRWQFADERDDHLYIEIHGLARQQVAPALLREIRERVTAALMSNPWLSAVAPDSPQPLVEDSRMAERVSTDLRARIRSQLGCEAGEDPPATMQERMQSRLHLLNGAWGPWVEVMGDFLMRLGVQFPPQLVQKINCWLRIAAQCQRWLPCAKLAILTERPRLLQSDAAGRLHSMDGPALAYHDGLELYAVHGVHVPAVVITNPERIAPAMIDNTNNAEVRRIMLERFGFARYLRIGNATRVDRDHTGTLWRKEIPGEEPLVMVEVVNSSPEPDGSFKTYFLRVPPNCGHAREAVAWTFDLEGRQYLPQVET